MREPLEHFDEVGEALGGLLVLAEEAAAGFEEADDDLFVDVFELVDGPVGRGLLVDEADDEVREDEAVLGELDDEVHVAHAVVEEVVHGPVRRGAALEGLVVALQLGGEVLADLLAVLLVQVRQDAADVLDDQVVVCAEVRNVLAHPKLRAPASSSSCCC